jgi:hypothetical protein
VLTILYEAHH